MYPGTGTVSISLTSTALTGSGTNWQTAGYCDGTHFIGINTPRTVYKIASCTSNTAATLSVPFGLYGEIANAVASPVAFAPAAPTGCHSSASFCFNYMGGTGGDRNLTRTTCGATAWLYSITLNATYKTWVDDCLSGQLGGPTSGLTSAAVIGAATLPCSGAGCDGLVTDTVAAAANCNIPGTMPPCASGAFIYQNLGKNFGEAFGAPGIDNALAWRLSTSTLTCSPKTGLTPPNVTDIQLQTNMALHIVACTNDIASDSCGTTSVQRVVNAALGGACVLGP